MPGQMMVYHSQRPGKRLKLRSEPDNPYDPNAVSVWCGKVRIGFVPRSRNAELAKMLFFGHGGAFEAYVVGGISSSSSPSSRSSRER